VSSNSIAAPTRALRRVVIIVECTLYIIRQISNTHRTPEIPHHNIKSNPSPLIITSDEKKAIVPCLSPNPSSQSANFGYVVLVAIRNPLTAFPAYHQSKAEKYHNQVGQVDKKDWIEFRETPSSNPSDRRSMDMRSNAYRWGMAIRMRGYSIVSIRGRPWRVS
jgi:hypothetical protein